MSVLLQTFKNYKLIKSESEIGDYLVHKKGYVFKAKWYSETGHPVVRVSDTTSNSIDISTCKKINEKLAQQYLEFSLKKGDVVIMTVGSWPSNPASVVGKVIRVPQKADGALLNQNAVRIRANESMHQAFLYYTFKNPEFSSYLVGVAQGSANQASITLNDIFSYKAFVPRLSEQKEIAGVLASLDDKIDLLHRQNKTLEQLAQTIFKHWFVDFEFPISAEYAKSIGKPELEGKPYKSSGGKMVDSELGEIPEGWEVKTLSDEFNVLMGQSPKGETLNENNEGMVFYQGRTDFRFRFPVNRLYTSSPKRVAEKFDVLVSVRAPVGDINMAIETCCIGRGLGAVRSELKSYCFYKIKSMQDKFKVFEQVGTVFGSLSKTDFNDLECLVPDNVLKGKFNSLGISIDEKILLNTKQIYSLKILRDLLLPKLMSGEIRVNQELTHANDSN